MAHGPRSRSRVAADDKGRAGRPRFIARDEHAKSSAPVSQNRGMPCKRLFLTAPLNAVGNPGGREVDLQLGRGVAQSRT